MKLRNLCYALGIVIALALVYPPASWAGRIFKQEAEAQEKVFKKWCDADLSWKFNELPKEAMVPKARIPYAGFIYPDNMGGTTSVLRKYDMAFNGGVMRAAGWEGWDIKATQEPRRGLFGLGGGGTPNWAGHCNGWCAASMRHAEPKKSVVRRGVTFTPADIKGLLAEMYTYTDVEILAGEHEKSINPAMAHVILTNWIGRQQQPVAMDATPGKEVWNYPLYCYRAAAAKRGRNVEVKLNLGYVYLLDMEPNKAPRNFRYKMFHYMLELDAAGNIIGGDYYPDSDHIDMLWVSLSPKQGGTKGNERGCPFLNAKEVLAMWRESVSPEAREAFVNIDPLPEDVIAKKPADPQPADARVAVRPAAPATSPAPVTAPSATATVTDAPAKPVSPENVTAPAAEEADEDAAATESEEDLEAPAEFAFEDDATDIPEDAVDDVSEVEADTVDTE